MRIALLSTLDRESHPTSPRPAFTKFAGAMVVERQLDLALLMGCERVICLVEAVEREVIELQHRAQCAEMTFRAIRQPSRLAGMVTADDELLVLDAGILPDDEAVKAALTKSGILAFPADIAVPVGYERIDLGFAWAGAMLISGHLVEKLSDLPSDINLPSALMRIALQAGGQVIPVDRKLLTEGNWHLNADRRTLDLREKQWIDSQRRRIAFRAPGLAVAERAGARLTRDIVGRSAEPIPIVSAGICMLGAAGAGLIGFPALGIFLTSAAALFAHMGGVVERITTRGRPQTKPNLLREVVDYLIDPLFVILLVLAAPEELGLLRGFVPLILIGLLRLGERHASEPWRATYADRILLGLIISPAAFVGYSTEIASAIALLVLATRFFRPFRDE